MPARRSRPSAARTWFVAVVALVAGLVIGTAPADAAPPTYVVAGDAPAATGDQWGLHEAYFSELRAAITDPASFGAGGTVDAVYQIGTPRNVPLTAGSLNGVDVYFLSARDVAGSEIPVLQAFLARGGALVVHANAPGFFDTTSWLGFTLSPRVVYGDGAAPYTTTHRAPSPSGVLGGQASHPVVNGPFGQVSSFENWHTVAGWTSVPASATVLARTTLTGPDDNGSSNVITISNVATLAVIPAGALGTGWGPVVATSDVDTFSNAYTTGLGFGASDALCTLTGTSNGRLARDAFAWIAAQEALVVPTTTTTTTTTSTTTSTTTTSTSTTTTSAATTTTASGATTTTTTSAAPTTTTPGATTTTTVAGVPTTTGGLVSLPDPVRVLDTRSGIGAPAGAIGEGGSRTVDLRAAGVPADATMAVVNLTAVDPTSAGYVLARPTGGAMPDSSNLNFVAGQTVANAAFVALGSGARLDVINAFGSTHVLVDVTGYVAPGGARFVAATPVRLKDTRLGLGGTGIAGAGATQRLAVAGSGGVPADATAVVLNLTAVDPTSPTYLTVWPAGRPRPEVSNLNTAAGETRPNLVVVRLGSSGAGAGAIDIANAFGDVHVLVDVFGWFTTAPPAAQSTAVAPHRMLDTRTIGAPLLGGNARTVSTGMPGATAVVLNVTAVDATAAGYLTVYAADAPRPDTSNLNVRPGAATPNLVVVHPAADGTVRVFGSTGATHLVVDVVGRLG